VSPLLMSVIVFACVIAGAFLGVFLRNALPKRHLSEATKDVVKLGTGLIGTITGLVLGLLIASANGTYGTENSQVQQMTANIVVLDQTLAQYGAETVSARNLMRRAVTSMVDRIWRENAAPSGESAPFEATAAGSSLFDEILQLSPQNDRQRSLQARAIGTLQEIAKTRLLLFTEAGAAIPVPFLVVLIFWLAIIFASFSLFADNNATTVVALCIFALSASAAIFLILELGQPFTGLMEISSEPLRNALAPLSP
jgi:ABC-type multidrug transport system fused ATPase/permease subunit